MSFCGWHPHIESALVLNLRDLLAKGAVGPNSLRVGGWAWTNGDGDRVFEIRYRAELHEAWGVLDVTDGEGTYRIMVGSTPLHFGGRRWWLHCPLTSRRAAKLYRYAAIGKFCHRTAIHPRPTYASQRVSGLDRIMDRRWAIRRKLGDPGTLCDPLTKPKWMRRDTFEHYQAKDEYLDALEGAAVIRRWGRLVPDWLDN